MIRFKFLSGDINWLKYDAKWISNKLNNGDWDYWIVLEFINWHEATGETHNPKYRVSLSAISPEAAGKEHLEKAMGCCGMADDQITSEVNKVQVLSDYGVSAPLWDAVGDNAKKLLSMARYQARSIECMFGFFMDAPKNRLGNTGWDFIQGNIGFQHFKQG